MKDTYPNNLDLILCRNVLIYVDREAQKEIIDKFFDSLRPGGILILGRTETLFGDWRHKIDIISTTHRIYQKKSVMRSGYIEEQNLKKEYSRKYSSQSSGSTKTHAERLQELKNFREIFEQRRKAWEEKVEKRIQANRAALDRKQSKRPILSSKSKSFHQKLPETSWQRQMANTRKSPLQTTRNAKSVRKNLSKSSKNLDTGRLTKYRKRLKRVSSTPRISSVRSDDLKKRNDQDDNLDPRLAPDLLYKKLKERQKRNRSL